MTQPKRRFSHNATGTIFQTEQQQQLLSFSLQRSVAHPIPVNSSSSRVAKPKMLDESHKDDLATNGVGEKHTRSAVMHRSLNQDPPMVIASNGLYLELKDGRRLLDATGGAAVSSIGHADDR